MLVTLLIYNMSYTCHSGGCPGSDMTWELIGREYGIKTISYSFDGHTQYGENQKILTIKELEEGYQHVLKANEMLKRQPQYQPTYVKNLLNRNWFQVKNSDVIFAIGKFINSRMVSGGTGWAVQMAIDNKKEIFFFDQPTKTWNRFNYIKMEFEVIDYIPKLTENFAGIGTREINDDGINAVSDVYKTSILK